MDAPRTVLPLDGELTIPHAAVQRERLLAWLAETDPAAGAEVPAPTLELSAVEAIDSAGIQLLLALRHSLANRGQVLHCHGVPPPVADALTLYGLHERLHTRRAD